MTGARGRGEMRVCGRGTSSVCAPRLSLLGGGAVLWCGPRGGVCPRGQVGSGVGTGPRAARGHAQSCCVWASRERAKLLSLFSRAVRERAKPLSRRRPGPGRRTPWRSPASFSHLTLFHHLCFGPPTPAAPQLHCLPRLSPSISGFQPLFPRELASLTLLLVGT